MILVYVIYQAKVSYIIIKNCPKESYNYFIMQFYFFIQYAILFFYLTKNHFYKMIVIKILNCHLVRLIITKTKLINNINEIKNIFV